MGLTRPEALKILGLEEGCTERDIRERFKKLALKWHPDKNVNNPEESQKKFQLISAAHSKLTDTDSPDNDDLEVLLAEVWERKFRAHMHHRMYRRHHMYCDCDLCLDAEWGGMSDYDDSDEEYYYRDRFSADSVLRQFADKLYRNHNGPGRAQRARGSGWQDTQSYRSKNVSAEEASKHADELLQAEEKEKKEAEKRRSKNKKKKEAKKRRKARLKSKGKGGKAGSREGGSAEPVSVMEEDDSEDGDSDGKKEAEDDHEVEGSQEELSGEELDFGSAFIARAREKQAQQKAKTRAPPTSGPPSSHTPLASALPHEKKIPEETEEHNEQQKFPRNSVTEQPHDWKSVSESTSSSHSASMNGITGSGSASSSSSSLRATGTAKSDDSSECTALPFSGKEASAYEHNIGPSRHLAGQGNKAAKEGRYQEAVRCYSEAIELYPFDHRYYGNRSFCYEYLGEYKKALQDALAALHLEPNWPKGYFRKARALCGLKRYKDAESAYVRALELDPNYKDAEDELLKTKVEQMLTMGFPVGVCENALRLHNSVQAAVEAILSETVASQATVGGLSPSPPPPPPPRRAPAPLYNSSGFELPPRMMARQQPPQDANLEGRALWVGNINADTVSHKMITNLFKRYGDIQSVRVLPDRHCAFVNYTSHWGAAQALDKLQGYHIGGCELLLRYPENSVKGGGSDTTRIIPSRLRMDKKTGPVNGNECYFWRTTGCSYGGNCHYEHVPGHRGVDMTDGLRKSVAKHQTRLT